MRERERERERKREMLGKTTRSKKRKKKFHWTIHHFLSFSFFFSFPIFLPSLILLFPPFFSPLLCSYLIPLSKKKQFFLPLLFLMFPFFISHFLFSLLYFHSSHFGKSDMIHGGKEASNIIRVLKTQASFLRKEGKRRKNMKGRER